VKLSEIFWLAANEYLGGYEGFSCFAATNAAYDAAITLREQMGLVDRAQDFLVALGVDNNSAREFDEFTWGPERQGARYAWLMFASMYAEELGL
jgi:hypothetical protein